MRKWCTGGAEAAPPGGQLRLMRRRAVVAPRLRTGAVLRWRGRGQRRRSMSAERATPWNRRRSLNRRRTSGAEVTRAPVRHLQSTVAVRLTPNPSIRAEVPCNGVLSGECFALQSASAGAVRERGSAGFT